MIDNTLSEYLWALRKECPGKVWFDCEATHPAIARALRIDPGQDGAIYAMAPFRLAKIEERFVILAAYPAPLVFGTPTPDWFEIEAVIAWEPNADVATVLGDDVPQLVGTLSDDANQIHSSPRAFFQTWAMRRAQFAIQRQAYAGKAWHTPPVETDLIPGALMVGPVNKIRWNPAAMPPHIECVGVDPREVNKAILRAAYLPRASAAPTDIRSAA